MRSKIKNNFPPCFFLALPPPLCGTGRQGMRVTVSSSHIIPDADQQAESFPCSSGGSIPQETVFCKLLECGSPFHSVQSFRHNLFQCRTPPAPGSLVAPRNLLQCGLLSPQAPGRSLFQHGVPMGSQPCLGHLPVLVLVSSMGWRWILASPWTSMGCRRTACFTMVVSMGCRGISDLEFLLPLLFHWPCC